MPEPEAENHVARREIAVLKAQHDDCQRNTTERLNALHAKVTAMGERMNEIHTAVQLQRLGLDFKSKALIAVCTLVGPAIALFVDHLLK